MIDFKLSVKCTTLYICEYTQHHFLSFHLLYTNVISSRWLLPHRNSYESDVGVFDGAVPLTTTFFRYGIFSNFRCFFLYRNTVIIVHNELEIFITYWLSSTSASRVPFIGPSWLFLIVFYSPMFLLFNHDLCTNFMLYFKLNSWCSYNFHVVYFYCYA